jgi:phytoene dehydrogenase-like protein
VHLADGLDGLARSSFELASGLVPEHPFVLLGQYSMTDPTRCPPGAEVAWAYTHVPHAPRGDAGGELSGRWERAELDRLADRIEREVELRAPGFRETLLARHVMGPDDFTARDANLAHGAINNGTAELHQQLVFRPLPGLGRPETGVPGLYLASAAAHPGGSVHGAPGANAARAALRSAWRRP